MGKLLENRVALITGAASGIGKATVVLFVEQGAAVIAVDIDEASGRRMESELGGQVWFRRADVADEESVKETVAQALERFGRIDVVVTSAGIAGGIAPLAQIPLETFEHVFAVNVRGTFLAMKYTIPSMVASGGGTIVNVASAAGMVGAPDYADYCSSKGAIIQLSRCAAIDYADYGIRVNSVCPGLVDTPMTSQVSARLPASKPGDPRGVNLLHRAASAAEIASAILFLASDQSTFATGSALVVDGGKLAV